MRSPRFEVIRDPLWDNIRLDEAAMAVLDIPIIARIDSTLNSAATVPGGR